MAKFTIRTSDGGGVYHFVDAVEYANVQAATDDAQIALLDMARDKMPNGKQAEFVVVVENDIGVEIYRASLSFAAKAGGEIEHEKLKDDAAAVGIIVPSEAPSMQLVAGKHLRIARAFAGMSINHLAVAARVPAAIILRLEASGQFGPLTAPLLVPIVVALRNAGVRLIYPQGGDGMG